MKRHILCILCLVALMLTFSISWGQQAGSELAPDQNPNYTISQAKYTGMSDSINEWHSTTVADTYKAIDWMQDRADARADRRQFRRQLRLERSMYAYDDYYAPSYYGSYRNYNNGYYRNYHNSYYRGYNRNRGSFYVNPVGAGYWWR